MRTLFGGGVNLSAQRNKSQSISEELKAISNQATQNKKAIFTHFTYPFTHPFTLHCLKSYYKAPKSRR
jgi:hypothetical protein